MTLNLLQVIVDVGTGYFMEKDIKTAQDYFSRKVRDGKLYLWGGLEQK